jgi:hypothetical protein
VLIQNAGAMPRSSSKQVQVDRSSIAAVTVRARDRRWRAVVSARSSRLLLEQRGPVGAAVHECQQNASRAGTRRMCEKYDSPFD